MYSLYRAWFGGAEESGSGGGYPRLETTGLAPPDTLVRVGNDGEYHFVAHRAVLAAHSGYLKALLAATASADAAGGAAGSASHEGHAPMITSVTVPSTIGSEAFAPLLNYMYTGRLEVSLDNIYTVLLATHLLHMPGALEQCRAALLRLRAPPAVVPPVSTTTSSPSATQQQQQQQTLSSSVLRPVPNRLLGPAFCWPQSAASHLYPPHVTPHLPPALQLPPAMSLLPGPIVHKSAVSYGTKERSLSPASMSSQHGAHQPRSASVSPELVVASSASSTTEPPQSGTRGPSPSVSSGRVSVSDSNPDNLQSQSQQPKCSSSSTAAAAARRHQKSSVGTRQRLNSRSGRSSQAERSSSLSSNGGGGGSGATSIQTPGVVYDVACCDGPVRFQRVLNENYSPAAVQASATQPPPPAPSHRVTIPQCNGRSNNSSSSSCRVVEPAADNLPAAIRENDENEQRQLQPSLASNNNSENRSSGSYTCSYCRHTFKSQYCYRKHARRHLLPTDSGNVATERQPVQPQPAVQQPPQVPARPAATAQQLEVKKREVRLLDLNVQYYPCKICGSKFPSYYFVHKHRKLCHANVDDPPQQQQSSSQNNSRGANEEPQQPKTTMTTGASQTQLQQAASTSENAQQQEPA